MVEPHRCMDIMRSSHKKDIKEPNGYFVNNKLERQESIGI